MPAHVRGAKRRREPASSQGLAARRAALGLIEGVLGRHQALDGLLTSPELGALDARDRAFARLLAATTFRRLGQIDAALGDLLDRPLAPRAAPGRNLLRLGAAQILFLGTPAHAAVASTVGIAASAGATLPYKGLINAVLRRLAEQGAALLAGQDAARLNTPDWLWSSWSLTYGEPTARAIAEAHLTEPPLDFTLRPGLHPEVWAEKLQAQILPTGALRRAGGGRIEELPGFAEGAWWVQDAAAALPARLLPDPAGRTILDLCAAPGGKTAQLAAAGARVVAVDRSPARLRRLEQNLARLNLTAHCLVTDAADWRADGPASAILLDAPCSSTGTIRRHPDVAHLKRPAELPKLTALQDRLLEAAIAQLAPGGVLVYCTCSLQPEEGSERITSLLARTDLVSRLPIRPDEVAGLECAVTPEGDLRTLPCHLFASGGIDGFYACRLIRA